MAKLTTMIEATEASEGRGLTGGGSPLAVCLLGPWDVRLHGRPLRPLRSRKGEWLLALLVLHRGRAVARDWLAGTLWPDSPNAQALYNLRRNLSDLRRALGPEGCRLRAPTPHTISLDLDGAWVDVAQFDDLMAKGDGLSLAAAVRQYRGPLLPDCLETWIVPERTAREQAYLGALERLAQEARQRTDHAAAAHYLQLAVAVDPLSESARVALMLSLAARGDVPAAARVYHEFSRLLQREMSARPAAETTVLYERLCAASYVGPETADRSVPAASGAGDPGRIEEPNAGPAGLLPGVAPAAPPSSLPEPVSSFIGRERELGEIVAALAATRVLTLTGPGGVGKSRLAIRVGERLALDYSHGVWFVELAALAAGAGVALVTQTVAQVLGAAEQPGRPLLETLREFLRPKRLLLILDNCEHLLPACATLVTSLLEGAPELRVLITSRQSLGIVGESDWRVPSLSLPPAAPASSPATPPGGSSALLEYEAVRLFVERGRAAARCFALTPQNAAAVVEVCRRLDGLPLALELAAARLKALAVEQIAARLGDRFQLLTDGDRVALPRQQTLRAAIDWSYDLLCDPERRLLRALSVFPTSFPLEAAEAVCKAVDGGWWSVDRSERGNAAGQDASVAVELTTHYQPPTTDLLDLLTQLVDKSLVLMEVPGAEVRYRLLETVREYAAGQWRDDEEHGFRRRHAEYFCALAALSEPLPPAAEVAAHMDRLEREHDHLRAAVDWALSEGDAPLAWRLGATLGGFWQLRGYWREGRKRLADILSLGDPDANAPRWPPHILVERGHTLDRTADLALMQNDDRAARELFEQSLAIYRRLGDEVGAAYSRTQLGNLARRREEFARARALLCESLRFYEAREDRSSIAWVLSCLGHVAEDERDHSSSVGFFRQSLAIWRDLDHPPGVVHGLICLGRVLYLDRGFAAAKLLFTECLTMSRELRYGGGVTFALYALGSLARLDHDYALAAAYHREALDLYRELGDDSSVAGSLAALGFTLHAQGDARQAAALFREALQINRKLGNRRQLAHCLEGLAGIATGEGCGVWGVGSDCLDLSPGARVPAHNLHPTPSLLTAARLFGAAGALRERDSSRWPADQADFERNLATLQARLDSVALAAAWEEGAVLPVDQAIALGLSFG